MSNRQVCFALIQSSNWEKVIRSSANVERSHRCRYLPFLFVGIIESNLGQSPVMASMKPALLSGFLITFF